MIACYAWTDTQIVNILQVCQTRYAGETIDLFVLTLERVSRDLLKAVRRTGIFRSLIEIEPPVYERLSKCRTRLPGIKTMHIGKLYQKYFDSVVGELPEGTGYSDVLIPGFWAESLHLLRAFTKKGMMPNVHFVEEGFYSYVKNSFLCRIDDLRKERLERILRYGSFYNKACSLVRDICLYCPENLMTIPSVPVWEIPPMDNRSSLWQAVFKEIVPDELLEEYRKRKYIYLVGAHKAVYEPDSIRTNEVFTRMCECVDASDLVVRLHPTLQIEHDGYTAVGAFADEGKCWFEAICTKLDLTNKVFITRNSSVLTSLKGYGVSYPKVIMTYKLYDYYEQHGDAIREHISSILKNHTAVYVPESMEEFIECISGQ